ncbi:MAG: Wzt carbohydrate-binding domain-containing protein [Planctomycetota bacterium]
MPASVDTSVLNYSPDKKIKIKRVSIKSDSNAAISVLDTPIEFEIEVRVMQEVKDVMIGWTIYTSDGIAVINSRSSQSIGTIQCLTSGDYGLKSVLLQNYLNPGYYSLHVAAHADGKAIDYVKDALLFRVTDSHERDALRYEDLYGLVRLPVKWHPSVEKT